MKKRLVFLGCCLWLLNSVIAEEPLPNVYQIVEVPSIGFFYLDDAPDSVKYWLRRGEPHEMWNTELIRKYTKRGSVVIDIGAHIGTQTIPMSQAVGDNGQVIAFEPQEKLFKELLMNIELNQCSNVKALPYAIGNEEHWVEFNPTHKLNAGQTQIGFGGERVEMKKLDSFNLTNVSLIKIDVEHTELDVLEGAVHTILKNQPVIVIEIMGGYEYSTAPRNIRKKIYEVITKLQSLNYSVHLVHFHDYLALPNPPSN